MAENLPKLPIIDDERLKTICKMGQGKDCCIFILAGLHGIECCKNSPVHANLILESKADMVAQGDNCEGLPLQG